jgi:hypothetical protein
VCGIRPSASPGAQLATDHASGCAFPCTRGLAKVETRVGTLLNNINVPTAVARMKSIHGVGL